MFTTKIKKSHYLSNLIAFQSFRCELVSIRPTSTSTIPVTTQLNPCTMEVPCVGYFVVHFLCTASNYLT